MPTLEITLDQPQYDFLTKFADLQKLTPEALVEELAQREVARLQKEMEDIKDRVNADQYVPSASAQLVLTALNLCKAVVGKAVPPNDFLPAVQQISPNLDIKELEAGVNELAAKGLVTFEPQRSELTLTQAGADLTSPKS